MSNIGIDIRNIGKKRTGDEVVFFNLIKGLVSITTPNTYKLFTDITDKNILEKISQDLGIVGKNNFEIISLKTANRFTWNFWAFSKYICKNPVDIYLTQYIVPLFVPEEIKIATIIHDVSFKAYQQFIKYSDLFFLNLLIPRSLKRADKIIAVSKFTRDEILKYYKIPPEKVDWTHNAVADDFLAADVTPEKLEKVRKKYDLPEKYILYIGTLQPRKNIPTLIEAYANLKVKPSDMKLVIAGGKGHNFDPRINEMVKKYNLEDKVIFPGFVDEEDKAAVMKSAEIFCFPSFYEGFGIPILEAMSVGTPTIVSDIAPHREIAVDAALYFDPKNPEDLADKLKELINNDNIRQNLIQKGLERVKNFSWKNTAEKMLEIFGSMK